MKTNSMKVLAIACGAALTLVSGVSMAESQYGYNSAGTGTVTATAKVNLSVTVPKLILLKVGSSDTTGPVAVVDTLSWTATASIPNAPTTPVTGNNTGVVWDGTAPTIAAGSQPAAIPVAAWTNAGSATISCAVPVWSPASGGPVSSNFTVSVTGTLPHPGANLGACGGTTALTANTLLSGTWAYVLAGTPSSWTAGAYTTTVTYTASGI